MQPCGIYGGKVPHPSRWQHRRQRPSSRARCRDRNASGGCQVMHGTGKHGRRSAGANFGPARRARQGLRARGPRAALRAGRAVLVLLAMAAVVLPAVRLLMRSAWHSLGRSSQSSIHTRLCMHQAAEHSLQALCVVIAAQAQIVEPLHRTLPNLDTLASRHPHMPDSAPALSSMLGPWN